MDMNPTTSTPIFWPMFLSQFKGPGSLNCKKPVSAFRVKKGGVCLQGCSIPKSQYPGSTSWYSPCTYNMPCRYTTRVPQGRPLVLTFCAHPLKIDGPFFFSETQKPVFCSLKSRDPLNWPKQHWRFYAKSCPFDWNHSTLPNFLFSGLATLFSDNLKVRK